MHSPAVYPLAGHDTTDKTAAMSLLQSVQVKEQDVAIIPDAKNVICRLRSNYKCSLSRVTMLLYVLYSMRADQDLLYAHYH